MDDQAPAAIEGHDLWIRQKDGSRRRVALFSGEMHYWRNDPQRWPRLIELIKGLGIEIVQSYVPWYFHALDAAATEFDFVGRTDAKRNLVGFIEEVRRQGLYLVARPGPLIDAECVNFGLAEPYCYHHFLSPKFQEGAGRWLRAVGEVLAQYETVRGGPILIVQADNETYLHGQNFAPQLGTLPGGGPFKDFLKSRYPTIERLNAVWHTTYTEWDDIGAYPRMIQGDGVPERRRVLDYKAFSCWYARTYVLWVVRQLREAGIRSPVMHNSPMIMGHWNWPDLQHAVDFHGVDTYQPNEMNQTGLSDAVQEMFRIVPSYARIPYLAEFQSGAAADFKGLVTDNHYVIMATLALACGFRGWNWFMLVEREHYLETPILDGGVVRHRTYQTFRAILSAAREMDPSECQRPVSVGFTFDYAANMMRKVHAPPCDLISGLWRCGVDVIGVILECLEAGTHLGPVPGALVYTGENWLARGKQQALIGYLREGGTLLLFTQQRIRTDEDGSPCDLLGVVPHEKSLFDTYLDDAQRVRMEINGCTIFAPPDCTDYTGQVLPGTPLVGTPVVNPLRVPSEIYLGGYASGLGKPAPVGYIQQMEKGRLVVLGAPPSAGLALQVLEALGHVFPMRALDAPDVTVSLFEREFSGSRHLFLVATNLSDSGQTVRVRFAPAFRLGEKVEVRDMLRQIVDLQRYTEAGVLTITVPPKDGGIFEIIAEGDLSVARFGPERPVVMTDDARKLF